MIGLWACVICMKIEPCCILATSRLRQPRWLRWVRSVQHVQQACRDALRFLYNTCIAYGNLFFLYDKFCRKALHCARQVLMTGWKLTLQMWTFCDCDGKLSSLPVIRILCVDVSMARQRIVLESRCLIGRCYKMLNVGAKWSGRAELLNEDVLFVGWCCTERWPWFLERHWNIYEHHEAADRHDRVRHSIHLTISLSCWAVEAAHSTAC